jgi:ELWxxDGT repeat protein
MNAINPKLIQGVSPTSMVKDIHEGTGGSAFNNIVVREGKIYFAADDGTHGRELWVSDGTANGTLLVKDTLPGPSSGVSNVFLAYDGYVYFSAYDTTHGTELWRSDGTALGTRLFKDLHLGTEGSDPNFFRVFSDRLFFSAWGVDGNELWVSDGTTSGTSQLKDINPGTIGSYPLRKSVVLGDQLLFTADDGVSGEELWATDGSNAGTVRVSDIRLGRGGSGLGDLQPLGDQVLFRADDGIYGSELWRTDGTEEGTRLVKDIRIGEFGAAPFLLHKLGGMMIFQAHDGVHGGELWRSDGTESGTTLIKDILPGELGSYPVMRGTIGAELVFNAAAEDDQGVWITDGVEVSLLKSRLRADSALIEWNGYGFFAGYDDEHGIELWRTDGTSRGTRLVRDIKLRNALLDSGDPDGSYPRSLTPMGEYLYFLASDDSHGHELWRTTGEIDDPCGTLSTRFCPTIRDGSPGQLVGAPGFAGYQSLAIYSWYRCRSAGLATVSRMVPRGCALGAKVISSGSRMEARPYRISPTDRSWGYIRLRVQIGGASYFSGTYDLRQ